MSGVVFAPSHPALCVTGRVVTTEQGAGLLWPGSSVSFVTDAPVVEVMLQDDTGSNHLAVVVDGRATRVIGGRSGLYSVMLTTGQPGLHHITLHKRTEAWEGTIWLRGLRLLQGGVVQAPAPPALRLELYGDSITTGYALDGPPEDGAPAHKNHLASFAALTARTLNAAQHSIAMSGVGLTRSYAGGTMLEHWDRLTPGGAAWDFSRWPADVVVINLGQNDHWLGAGPELADAYRKLVVRVREKHRDAMIFLCIGCMDAAAVGSPIPGILSEVVEGLRDTRLQRLVFPHVPGGHPDRAAHAEMAERLTAAIRATLQ